MDKQKKNAACRDNLINAISKNQECGFVDQLYIKKKTLIHVARYVYIRRKNQAGNGDTDTVLSRLLTMLNLDGLTIMIHNSVWPQDHLQPMVTKDILLPSVQSTSKATDFASLVVEQELIPWYGVHGMQADSNSMV